MLSSPQTSARVLQARPTPGDTPYHACKELWEDTWTPPPVKTPRADAAGCAQDSHPHPLPLQGRGCLLLEGQRQQMLPFRALARELPWPVENEGVLSLLKTEKAALREYCHPYFGPGVLAWGRCSPSEDIWLCPETSLVVATWWWGPLVASSGQRPGGGCC